MDNWKTDASELHTKIARIRMGITPWSTEDIRFLALALCGEAGELANIVKKEWRGDDVNTLHSTLQGEKAIKELADVRIYAELLAVAFDIDLDRVCATKLEEVKKRWAGKL